MIDLSTLPLLALWASARLSGLELHWDPKARRVILRPLSGGAR
jgi:hypothetical protein